MSRGQQQAVIDASKGVQATDQALANTSFTNAQTDIGKTQGDIDTYGGALSKFSAANPYVNGGQAETAENQQLADTAAGQAEAGGEALQSLAARTGQNGGGAIAATEHMKEQAARDLMGAQAGATERRIGAETGYGEAVLGGTATKTGLQGDLTKTQGQLGTEEGGLAQGALSTEEDAAKTPSFFDTLGSSFAQGLGKTLGAGAGGVPFAPTGG